MAFSIDDGIAEIKRYSKDIETMVNVARMLAEREGFLKGYAERGIIERKLSEQDQEELRQRVYKQLESAPLTKRDEIIRVYKEQGKDAAEIATRRGVEDITRRLIDNLIMLYEPVSQSP